MRGEQFMQRGRENNEEGYKGLRTRGEQLFHREKEGLYRGFIRATSSRNPWSLTRDFEIYARCRREVCDTISRPIYGFREKSWIAMDPHSRPLAPLDENVRFSFVRGTRLYGDTRRRYPRRPASNQFFPKVKITT